MNYKEITMDLIEAIETKWGKPGKSQRPIPKPLNEAYTRAREGIHYEKLIQEGGIDYDRLIHTDFLERNGVGLR